MDKIRIITDSTSDLTQDQYDSIGADIISLKVSFGEDTYIDRKTMTPALLYKEAEKRKMLPKTSAPSLPDFISAFRKHLDAGEDIIFCGISSEFSSCLNNALLASNEFPPEKRKRIRCLDSRSLSSGIGLILFVLDKAIKEGKTLDEVYQAGLDAVGCVNAEFVVDTMEYLYKGGRCSGLSFFLGSALHMHPVIRVENGKMVVHKLTRGKLIKGCDLQVDEFKKQLDADNVDLSHIFVTSSFGGAQIAYMTQIVRSLVGPKYEANVVSTEAGSIVSSHCGKGTIGLLYITKRKVIGEAK